MAIQIKVNYNNNYHADFHDLISLKFTTKTKEKQERIPYLWQSYI